jgi:hypothetical protein
VDGGNEGGLCRSADDCGELVEGWFSFGILRVLSLRMWKSFVPRGTFSEGLGSTNEEDVPRGTPSDKEPQPESSPRGDCWVAPVDLVMKANENDDPEDYRGEENLNYVIVEDPLIGVGGIAEAGLAGGQRFKRDAGINRGRFVLF